MNDNTNPKVYTLVAFLLGYALINNLSSTEQNELGNFFMLVGQTLCTNGSYNFDKDWKGHLNNGHGDIRIMLDIVKRAIDEVNANL